MGRVLTHQQARAFYDRFGSKQDLQRIYEDPAIDVLLAHGDFQNARAVVEVGCGTGRLARTLLTAFLAPGATYLGLDVSETMVRLAREKLTPWPSRAFVRQTDGAPRIPLQDGACDRLLATYVFDLLSDDDVRLILDEARRVLGAEGLLCLSSLTFGERALSRTICRLWMLAHTLRPQLVGGCRPMRLLDHLVAGWCIVHRQVVCTLGLCTEVVVARVE